MFTPSHKTVIVLDRSPHFRKSSRHTIELDVFSKSRGPGFIPLAPIAKSLWTCNVEAVQEYIRVVYDLYPQNRLFRVITSDTDSTCLNSWAPEEQNLNFISTVLGQIGPPDEDDDKDESNMIHGLNQAIEVLCEPTQKQHNMRTSLSEEADQLLNKGRIICLTTAKTDAQVRSLEECVMDALVQHNKLAASTDTLLPVYHCELVLIVVTPLCLASNIKTKSMRELSPVLSSEIHVSQSGGHIAKKLMELVVKQFSLASTTVTGIPMKEEQNASSSANYDVELFHDAITHQELFKAGAVEGIVIASKEGLYTDTVTLKWCTPKSNSVELHPCTGCHRITPVDVISRPSSCLANFLLSGRAVMLEQPRKGGTKLVSHMLASHGGEIYIHTLATARSILEDPPSISEGCGGRLTDYRINDFGEFMKECRLAPVADVESLPELPIQRAKRQLEKMTRHFPLLIGETIIFNMLSHLDPLPSLIMRDRLEEDEMLECKKAIYHIVGMESRNEPLPIPTVGSRGKGPKREEQYRQMWNELEKLVRAHSNTSPMHTEVLQCLMECKRPSGESEEARSSGSSNVKGEKEEKMDVDQAWKQLDRFSTMTEREKQDLNKNDGKRSDSPPPKKMKLITPMIHKNPGSQSLLSMWTSRVMIQNDSRHAEFAGRLESEGNKAELYINLNEDKDVIMPPDISMNGKKK